MTNERGIALVITLLVVALLTITVVEFTYSVEVDQHMAHNALNSLQASLLARSGINVGEAFLLHDDDPLVDAYTEDWCPEHANGASLAACSFDAATSQLVVPDNMRLRVQIIDESSKLNINLTRPPNVNVWRTAKNNQNQVPPFQSWKTALGELFGARGVPAEAAENVADYWDRLYSDAYGQGGTPGSTPGVNPTPGATGQNPLAPTPGAPNALQQQLWDFPSLDDASVVPGLTANVLRRVRSVVTALPFNRAAQVNVNTASREVLTAIIGDAGAVDGIISQRDSAAIKQADLAGLLAAVGKDPNDPTGRNARVMHTQRVFPDSRQRAGEPESADRQGRRRPLGVDARPPRSAAGRRAECSSRYAALDFDPVGLAKGGWGGALSAKDRSRTGR